MMVVLVLQGTGKWYEMQDLHVTDILPQMITLTEAYIQVKGRCIPLTNILSMLECIYSLN